jgi:hypothetical protein
VLLLLKKRADPVTGSGYRIEAPADAPCVCIVKGFRCGDGQDTKFKASVSLRESPSKFALSQICFT